MNRPKRRARGLLAGRLPSGPGILVPVLEVPIWAVRVITALVLLVGVGLGWWARGRWHQTPKLVVLESAPERERLH